MSEWIQLPNRRGQETWDFDYQNIKYTMSISRFPDSQPAEVFVECSKSTSDYESLARDSALIISIALRSGVPLQKLRSSVTRLTGGKPASLTGKMLDEMTRAK
jgi:hypothetical protein